MIFCFSSLISYLRPTIDTIFQGLCCLSISPVKRPFSFQSLISSALLIIVRSILYMPYYYSVGYFTDVLPKSALMLAYSRSRNIISLPNQLLQISTRFIRTIRNQLPHDEIFPSNYLLPYTLHHNQQDQVLALAT